MSRAYPALAASLLAAAVVSAQQERPTFRSGTSSVSIYATVRASDGRLVPDLTQADFEIKDEGKVQNITVFSREIVPITVTVLLDMSGSQEGGVVWMRDAANAFVAELLPADRARIGTFGTEISISPRLTGDKAYLHRVLAEEIWPGGSTPLWNAIDKGMSSLASETGRRVILTLTDGVDTTSARTMAPSSPTGSAAVPVMPNGKPMWSGPLTGGRYDEVSARALREQFMVYGVGKVLPSRTATGPALNGGLSAEMISLALDSGGGFRIFHASADAATAMVQVAEELHHQYLIGFTPAVIDNKKHDLDVKVKRGGMTVQARKSYLANGK